MAVTNLNGEPAQTAYIAASIRNGSFTPPMKGTQSVPDHSRRHSLPVQFLPPNLWSSNTSRASLFETEEAARGEHILDEATVAHRISALRQLNGATRTRHQYAKSTGARNSTFSQPVIVRTYSGTRPQSRQREPPIKKEIHNMGKAELPPVEAFSFKGIMDSIQSSVAEDLERIAEICARSRYSLSNQYEVHMPPHGEGDPFLRTPGQSARANGPTLQAIGSDDEQTRHVGRGSRGGRRTKSMAYGTLETIMSSSKSSEEEKTKKKSAGVIAEEVRGRAAKKALAAMEAQNPNDNDHNAEDGIPDLEELVKDVPPRSATFVSKILDSTHVSKGDALAHHTSLVSQPAEPQTSIAAEEELSRIDDTAVAVTGTARSPVSTMPSLNRNESRASTLKAVLESRPSVFDSLTSWLPWSRQPETPLEHVAGRTRSMSHAEGSLRELLKGTEHDGKGKGVNRDP